MYKARLLVSLLLIRALSPAPLPCQICSALVYVPLTQTAPEMTSVLDKKDPATVHINFQQTASGKQIQTSRVITADPRPLERRRRWEMLTWRDGTHALPVSCPCPVHLCPSFPMSFPSLPMSCPFFPFLTHALPIPAHPCPSLPMPFPSLPVSACSCPCSAQPCSLDVFSNSNYSMILHPA